MVLLLLLLHAEPRLASRSGAGRRSPPLEVGQPPEVAQEAARVRWAALRQASGTCTSAATSRTRCQQGLGMGSGPPRPLQQRTGGGHSPTVGEAATNRGCVPAWHVRAPAQLMIPLEPAARMVVTYARVPLGLCWWCWCRRGPPSSAPRCRGLPWGRAASDQGYGQPQAKGGPRPQAQRQRGSGTRLGQPSRLPAAHEMRARTHAPHPQRMNTPL